MGVTITPAMPPMKALSPKEISTMRLTLMPTILAACRLYAQAFIAFPTMVKRKKNISAANTNIVIEDVEAVDCQHLIRTANSPRGHAHLKLRRLTARNCDVPIRISHTKNVTLEDLTIECKPASKAPPISLRNCQVVSVKNVVIKGLAESVEAIQQSDCGGVTINGLLREAGEHERK